MANNLTGYELLLGVTGGIAAYKAAALCSLLRKADAHVTVAMTDHARQFVGPLTFSTLSGRRVYSDLFAAEDIYSTQHISLTERADLVVVAPATANIIGKLAGGICDDLLSTLLCAADSNVLLAPAMNHRMWHHPAVVHNVETLRQWGCRFVGPESGPLACGDNNIGRMAEPEDIFACIEEIITVKPPKNQESDSP